ncbi:MAG: thermonuclease family protein [Pseudomonadota bacterium]
MTRTLALASCMLVWLAAFAQAGTLTVVDGDTLRLNGERLRLIGIDAPETGHRAQCAHERLLGESAKRRLAQLIQGGVTLRYDGAGFYGRPLVHVHSPVWGYVNELLVREGFARRWPDGEEWWCE